MCSRSCFQHNTSTPLWLGSNLRGACRGRTNIMCANKITFSFADGLALLSSPLCWRKRTLLSLAGDRRFISNDAPFVYWTKTINEPKRLSRSARIMLISKRDPLNAGRLLALLCSSPTTNTDFGWLRAGKIGLEVLTRERSARGDTVYHTTRA